ncbi:glycine betaine ABC transporter substrate-binding protein [Actinomadura atramentaria]|uniref:glycine betaine ABC transporter substrate-binding protein n=1 Tax=Actinomadura atramentaria TaxID=1990 RepID=UPI00035C2D36|nr:glycine betaine ABC transporter substrate-binding protein [Actinomadura atramentaria]
MRVRPLLAACAVLALAGCGLKPASAFIPDVEPGSIRPLPDLKGVKLRVTSKEFTEQLILGKIAVLALKAAGADVEDHTNVQGSATARRSITRGSNDLMWEYTGTGWITYLGQENPIPDAGKQFDAVRDLDLRRNHIAWLGPPAQLNNTYSIAVNQQARQRFGLRTLSDMAKVPVAQRTFCVESEFFSRNDGMRGMFRAYGLNYGSTVPSRNVLQMNTGVIFNAVQHGRCTFGEVTATDGRNKALHLTVLDDDRHFFPIYNPAITIREPLLRAHPGLTQIFAQISPKLTTAVMTDLNARADVDGDDPVFVARDWMRDQGLIK